MDGADAKDEEEDASARKVARTDMTLVQLYVSPWSQLPSGHDLTSSAQEWFLNVLQGIENGGRDGEWGWIRLK